MMNSSRRILLQSHGSLLRSYARAATNQFNCYSSETARLLEVGLTPAAKTTTKCSLAVTKLAIAKKHQCFFTSSSTNADTGGLHRRLAITRLELDTNESLDIKCEQGRSGKKFFAIIKSMSSKQVFFPNILIPEEAYQYVESIDQLLLALASRDDANVPQPDSQLHILERRNLKGVHFEFEFNVCLRRNNQYAFTAIARVGNVDRMVNRYRMFILPIRALPILRQTMAEMLAEHDGSQLLGPGPELPEWIMQAPPLREQKIPNLAQKRKRRTNQQQQNKEAFNENNQQLDQQNNSNIPHPQQSQQQQFLAQLQSLQQQMIPQQTTASNVAQMANLLNQLKTQAAQIEALTISTTNMLNAAAGQMYGNQQMPTAGQHSPIFGFPPPQLPIFPAFGFGTQQLMQTNNPSQLLAKIGQLQAQLNQQQQKSSTKNPRKNETMARPLGGQQNWANNRLGDLAAKKQRTVTFVPPQQKDQQQMTNAVNQTLVGKKNANEEKVVYDSEKAEQPNAVAEEIRRVLAETEQEITGAEEHAEQLMKTASEQTENVKEEEKKKSMGASFLKGKMKATG